MAEEKPSITGVVREIVLERPAIRECLILGIVNYSALARLIVEELEGKGVKTTPGAVKMALIRIGEEMRKERASLEEKVRRVIAGTVIELKSDLTVITFKKAAFLSRIGEALKVMERSRFFQLTQGVETFTVVISREDAGRVVEAVGRSAVVDLIEGQTAIILISPEEIIETPGFVAFVTLVLSSSGLNITQIISCHEDTILVVDRRDAPRAYQVLEGLIQRMRDRSSDVQEIDQKS